jgi:hypothetical protein
LLYFQYTKNERLKKSGNETSSKKVTDLNKSKKK